MDSHPMLRYAWLVPTEYSREETHLGDTHLRSLDF